MAHDPDDKRPLFARVVDDIKRQILDGKLQPEEQVPPARELAETYGIAAMTAQRALRELQAQGLTYGMPGKGSFVHPDALARLIPAPEPVTNPAEYQAAITTWLTALQTGLAEIDEAINAEDWDRLKAARAAIDQTLHDNHGHLLGATLYSYRQAGIDIDAELTRVKDEATRQAATRRAKRDQPTRRKPKSSNPPT